MLTPELKKLWVAALRSGKYKQGSFCLQNKFGDFCCLGVLADLVEPESWQAGERHYTWNGNTSQLQDGKGPILLDYNTQYKLAEMNDHTKMTFDQIADYIEENL